MRKKRGPWTMCVSPREECRRQMCLIGIPQSPRVQLFTIYTFICIYMKYKKNIRCWSGQ